MEAARELIGASARRTSPFNGGEAAHRAKRHVAAGVPNGGRGRCGPSDNCP